MGKIKKNFFIIFILSLLSINSLNAKTYIDPFTAMETTFSLTSSGVTLTTEPKTKQLLKGASYFNCNTGEIGLNVSVADDIADFLKSFGDNTVDAFKSIVKEMAMQESIEFMLDLVALIHYKITQEGVSALSIFQGLQVAQLAGCMSSAVMDAIEIDLEAGLGMNVYDIFSGKAGINLAGAISVYSCLQDAFGFPKDEAAKEKFAESQRWVRHLFYKLLNESFEMLFNFQMGSGRLSAECKEIDKQLKNENLEASLSQFGCFMNPLGTEICNYINVAKPTPVTTKIVNEEKSDAQTMNDAQTVIEQKKKAIDTATQNMQTTTTFTSATREQQALQLKAQEAKKALSDPYVYEVNLSQNSTQDINFDIIDMTDMTSEEIRLFNANIYEQMRDNLSEGEEHKTYRKQEAFLNVLQKVFGITTTSSYMLDSKLKVLEAKKKNASGTDVYVYDETTSDIDLLKTTYYSELYQKALYFNGLKNAILTTEEMDRERQNLHKALPKSISEATDQSLFNKLLEIRYNNLKLEKLKKWKLYEDSVAGGFPLVHDIQKSYQSPSPVINVSDNITNPTTTSGSEIKVNDIINYPIMKLLAKYESRGKYNAYNSGNLQTPLNSEGKRRICYSTVNGSLTDKTLGFLIESEFVPASDPFSEKSDTIVEYGECKPCGKEAYYNKKLGKWQRTGCNKRKMLAMGKYQFKGSTLELVMKKLKLDVNTIFNEKTQEVLGYGNLMSKNSIKTYLEGTSSGEAALTEAMISLAKEWASMPVPKGMQGKNRYVNAGESYHSGDGANKSDVPLAEVISALNETRAILSGQEGANLNYDLDISTTPSYEEPSIAITNEEDIIKMVKNQFIQDINVMRNKNVDMPYKDLPKINELLAIRKPLHELEYLKIFYQLESPEQILSFLSKKNGEILFEANEDTSYSTFDKEFKRNSYFLSNNAREATNYPVETINYIIGQVKLLKEIYGVELLDLYSKRLDAYNRWLTQSYQDKRIYHNNSIREFKETEFEKIKLKLLQKRILIKMFLEREVQ